MGRYLETIQKKEGRDVPVWFMRQAGRYLPEYRRVREQTGGFLELCYDPMRAADVTLQPIRRFGFDAAILFSDILVIPDAMGQKVEFVKGEGPKLEALFPGTMLEHDQEKIQSHLKPVADTVSRVRKELPEGTDLIGFAGAPWTVACYMTQGAGSKDFAVARGLAYANPEWFGQLIDQVMQSTITYLKMQIEAGAQAIQLFDSWANLVSPQQLEMYCIQPAVKIKNALKAEYPDIPFIAFPKGLGSTLPHYIESVKPDVVGVDYSADLQWLKKEIQPRCMIQGNLDPVLLASHKDDAVAQTNVILQTLGDDPFIFNLGHGILPHTPIEHVMAALETIRNFKRD